MTFNLAVKVTMEMSTHGADIEASAFLWWHQVDNMSVQRCTFTRDNSILTFFSISAVRRALASCLLRTIDEAEKIAMV